MIPKEHLQREETEMQKGNDTDKNLCKSCHCRFLFSPDYIPYNLNVSGGNMTYTFILVETRGRVGLITLHRPQVLNALNNQLVREVMDALEEFDKDEGIGAMVI